ncbi:MAG: Lhr family helicase [Armatimonadota bacterium]
MSSETTQERSEELTAFLDEWLRFYGPVSTEWLAETLALPIEEITPALDDLQDEQRVVQGRLVVEGNEDDLCDAENFEILLRMARTAAVPSFEPLPVEDLPRFLAQVQGISAPGQDADDLWARLEGLSAYPARAELWEEAILPARMRNYEGMMLDGLMQEGNLHWIGIEKGRVAFCLEDDLPLLPAREAKDDLRDLLPDIHGRYGLSALAVKSGQPMEQLVTRLWDGVWSGIISNDSAAALRKGIQQDFLPPKLPQVDTRERGRRVPRGGFNRWTGAAPFAGNWYRLAGAQASRLRVEDNPDLLEDEERARDRARLLLDRYGLLFRELLQWETPPFQWPAVFRALRLMELSGEVLGGIFFHGIPGLQFIAPRAFRLLQRKLPDGVWWLNACDPASCCGLPLSGLRGTLPKRLPGNYVAYRGGTPVFIIERNGKALQFLTPPDDPRLPEYLLPLHHLLDRRFQPLLHVTVESINGENPCASPYLDTLSLAFNVVRDYNRVFVSRRLA